MKGKVTSAMKKSLFEFSIILLAMVFCVSSLYAGELPEDVLEANLDLDNRFITAMSNKDFDGVKECFYNSPDLFLVIGGNVYLGMEGLEESFEGKFEGDPAGFLNAYDTILPEIKKIDRWQIGNIVHAIGVAKYTLTKDGTTTDMWEVWTDARQKIQDKWVYIYDHVTLIEPPADPDNITPPYVGLMGAIPTGVVQSGILPEDVLKGNLDLDKRFEDAMSSEEPDAIDKVMECMYDSPDLCVSLGGDVLRGPDAVRANIEGFKSSLPDVDLEILDIGHFQVGDTVFALGVAQYSFYDENRNPIGGFDELWSDARVEVNGTWVYLMDHVTIIPSYAGAATSVASTNTQPTGFSLDGNYPNPFNPATTISYRLDQAGMVNLVIYDLLGRKVETLVDEMKTPGSYEVSWNAENYPSGMYFCRLNLGGSKVLTQKMMLVR